MDDRAKRDAKMFQFKAKLVSPCLQAFRNRAATHALVFKRNTPSHPVTVLHAQRLLITLLGHGRAGSGDFTTGFDGYLVVVLFFGADSGVHGSPLSR